MRPDDAAQVLEELPAEQVEKVLDLLPRAGHPADPVPALEPEVRFTLAACKNE